MKKSKKPQIPQTPAKADSEISSILFETIKWHKWIVFAIGIFLYSNTLTHEYTQDDAIVIYDNIYTKAGISGWADIFSKDTFAGFFKDESKLNLVSGGRYRPFTLAMFALEYQLVGNNPWLGHLINVLLFGFLCLMIYQLCEKLFCNSADNQLNRLLILSISLIFATHPIHTEAVANIKGRDEIMAMLCSIISLYYLLQYIDFNQIKYLVFSVISLFIGLMSKENAITFLLIAPLSLYFFRNISIAKSIQKASFLLIPIALFLVVRTAVVGSNLGTPPLELMNNPFLKMINGIYTPFSFSEKIATIIFTLGKYIQLLFLPYPLTHDYYPRHIDIMSFSDIGVILSLLVYIFLGFLAIKSLRNKSILGFGILFFLITLSIVSNIVFPIGTNMAERFMFMPSLGFAICLGYILQKYLYGKFGKSLYISALSVILILFSLKTFTRNQVWESDYTLFTTDVKTSTNSAKILNAAAGSITAKAIAEVDLNKKQEMLIEASGYINRAIEIHPTYKNAYLIKGNILNYLKDFDGSMAAYEMALKLDSDFADAKKNYAITLRDAGRKAGEVENNLVKSDLLLSKSDSLLPNQSETFRLLGIVNGMKGNHQKAIEYFEKVVKIEPQDASTWMNLGQAYRSIGQAELAEKYVQKAIQIDPSLRRK